MNMKKAATCSLCGKRLRKGGDNYRIECVIASDFDGYINMPANQADIQKLIDDINLSDLGEEELNEDVYFELKGKLCHSCRNEIVDFIKGRD